MNVTYIGASWPQPSTTAAGSRTIGLLKCLLSLGYKVTFLTYKKPNPSQMTAISQLPIATHYCPANDEARFAAVAGRPDICLFEKFTTEEMFSFLVHRDYPNCLRILDTQDLHCLRTQRQALSQVSIAESKAHVPSLLGDEMACREFASIHRSDLVVFCSDHELEVVKGLGVGNGIVLPMFYERGEIERWKGVEVDRKDMIWLGNYTHAPNRDSLVALSGIWPEIQAKLPEIELHIYGAFFPPRFSLNLSGVQVKGQVASLDCLATYRVMLAPLLFGAGIKGKITDAWLYGVLPVTTSIGAEGLYRQGYFPGLVEDNWPAFSAAAIAAYHSPTAAALRNQAWTHLAEHFSLETCQALLSPALAFLQANLTAVRRNRPVQQLLWSQTLRSTEYLSKYLQTKTKHC